MGHNNLIPVYKYWKKKLYEKNIYSELICTQETIHECIIKTYEIGYLNKITNKNEIAKFTVICAVYNFLLKRLISEFDGFIVSNFNEQPNSLVFSFSNDLEISFKDYLKLIKSEILETLNNSNYDHEVLGIELGLDHLKFSSRYGINFNSVTKLECNGLLFDIVFNDSQDIEIKVSYQEGFVNSSIVKYLVQHFCNFIINLEKYIEVVLSEYDLLNDIEREQLLVDFNKTESDYPKNKTIVDLFEEQVVKTPNNVATVFQNTEITYKDLNEKSNQLANFISSVYTINKGDIIGVFLPKSDNGIIALLAILKLGAVYLPIDTNYPQERIDYLIKDSGLKLLIEDGNHFLNIDCDRLDINHSNLKNFCHENLDKEVIPSDLAYIIYTSGSTGQPKGVMVEHTSNVNMSLDQIKVFNVTQSDKVVWFASVSFDASISEIMMALYSGATLCIPTQEAIKEQNEFVKFLKVTNATVVTFPPSYLGLLEAEDIAGLRCIITAGESANAAKAIEIVNLGKEYYNAYGPTECAVCVSIYKVTEKDFDTVNIPIGLPIANTQIYILDESLQPVPIGVTGKIYVSGVGVARGYLNKTELTNEKFISNPFIKGTRLYDTGDLGCWLSDGNVEFQGRKDSQVKLRGYRIELGEIENTLLQYSDTIKQVAVDIKEYNQESVLVAYFVSSSLINKSELRSFLQSNLPDYMLPSFYIALDKLPITPNGKIDRKALPNISGDHSIRTEYIAPLNKTQEVLARIWQEVLGIEKIGIKDNFFELGGHSLLISQVINRVQKLLGKTLSFKTFFSNPTIAELSQELQDCDYASIPKAAHSLTYPLTASQSRLWILSQLEGGSLAYNMPAAVKLKGVIDFEKFEKSFQMLIDRYEILRTAFKINGNGDVYQSVLPSEQIDFKIVEKDFSQEEKPESNLIGYLNNINNIPFDLEQSPLVRAALTKLAEKEYVFFLSLHHIIGDGWSIELLISEIITTYNALIEGKTPSLPELNIQFKDYAVWLNAEINKEEYSKSEQYWLQKFEGELPILNLPAFKKRPLVQTYNGNTISHQFSTDFFDKLKAFSKQKDVTLFMTLMAGINALLSRYTGQNDIIIGTPVAGREHPDLENQIGLFLNTLPIRTQFDVKKSFLELLAQQKETLLAAYDHQNYPFDALVDKLNLKKDLSRSPLFDVLMVLQNQSQFNKDMQVEKIKGLTIDPFKIDSKTAQFDLKFNFFETEKLNLDIEYNTEIYDVLLIERIFPHLENLLSKVFEHPDNAIESLNYITKVEENQLLFDFNDNEVDYPKNKTILNLFEDQVKISPNETAIQFADKSLSYAQLNEQANQFANCLRGNFNIEPNSLIGIKLERSEQLLVVIFGILKTGAAYVPIDVNYPQERIDYIEKDSNCSIIITQDFLDEFFNSRENYSNVNLNLPIYQSNLAYIIYTSGTTGDPKGVMIEHKNVYDFINWSINEYQKSSFDIVYAVTSYCFDLSIYEFFYPLAIGKKIRILKNALEITNYLKIDKNILLNTVPSVVQKLLEDQISLENVALINMAGEVLPVSIIDKLPIDKIEVRNLYGPSEDTTYSTCFQIKDTPEGAVSIGKPISNTQVLILDENYELVPLGVTGKIFVSGNGVTRGYLNKPELTADKFLPNPYKEGQRMYDTGDLGSWLPDGNISFLGRKDGLIKLRGYRIELGEIEQALSKYSNDIKQVTIDVKEHQGESVLVAYFVSSSKIDKAGLRAFLQTKLPEYMVPNFYVELDSLPLTPNGKIDRKKLPNISEEIVIRNEYIPPSNEVEESLVQIWQEVLGLEKIGITDNFFELGGNSLKSIKLINIINDKFKSTISLIDFFEGGTIKKLSELIQNSQNNSIVDCEELEMESFKV